MIKIISFLIVLAIVPISSFAQKEWHLIKDEDGIKIYTRRLENVKFKEIRADFDLKATEDQLINILKNISHHKDWSYGTKKTFLISKKGKDTLIYYSEVSLPWPLSNRDLVIELSFKKDTLNKTMVIQAKSISGVLPDKPGLIRVPFSMALWDIRVQSDNLLKIHYTFSTNPGGALPAWLVNFAASTGPYNSFRKLKELVRKEGS
ncbi:MAG TPA: START domain-containing protein [Mucilaginibacter sp.]|jgi:hypothetical protein|nr:START domain-containing protein [Mucilaginibacter sp.]